jgi:hypothetical protein
VSDRISLSVLRTFAPYLAAIVAVAALDSAGALGKATAWSFVGALAVVGTASALLTALREAERQSAVDRALAAGRLSSSQAGVAARRRARLMRPGYRRMLAGSLRRLVAESVGTCWARPMIPLDRRQISESADQLDQIAAVLEQPVDPPVQVVAMVNELLTSPESPVYRSGPLATNKDLRHEANRILFVAATR